MGAHEIYESGDTIHKQERRGIEWANSIVFAQVRRHLIMGLM